MSNTGRLDRVLCFEWARGLAATMVVFLHVMSGITDNYSMEAIGGGSRRCLVYFGPVAYALGGAGLSHDLGCIAPGSV